MSLTAIQINDQLVIGTGGDRAEMLESGRWIATDDPVEARP